ncbi:MAG: hypothetical protein ACTSPY_13585 [Candidatus Helarchaeota archaeon]
MEKSKLLKIILPIVAGGIIILVLILMFVVFPNILFPGSNCTGTPLIFNEEKRVKLDSSHGSTWSIPVYDGEYVVVSAETRYNISVRKYYLNLTAAGSPVEIVNHTDTGGLNISDHKHIFQAGYHYIVFSIAGNGSGGDLYLVKFDKDFNKINFTVVVKNDSPTNDMLLVGDGTNVYVGKFWPGVASHKIIKYDADLNWQANYTEGTSPNNHANGASCIYYNNKFYMVAPEYVGPGVNSYYFLIIYDQNWSVLQSRTTIFTDINQLGLINGLVTYKGQFIIHFCNGPNEANPISTAIYDSCWNLLNNYTVYEIPGVGSGYHASHTIIVEDTLYMGYTNETVGVGFAGYVSKFSISTS